MLDIAGKIIFAGFILRHNRLFKLDLADARPAQPGNLARIVIYHNQLASVIRVNRLPGFSRQRVIGIRRRHFRADAQRPGAARRERTPQHGFFLFNADNVGFAGLAKPFAPLHDGDDFVRRHLKRGKAFQLPVFVADLRDHKRGLFSAGRRIGVEVGNGDFILRHAFRVFNRPPHAGIAEIALRNNHAQIRFFLGGIDDFSV